MLPCGSDFCRPNFWDVKTHENTRFFLCHFFGTSKNPFRTHRWVLTGTQLRSEWAPCLLVGAEWVAIAIRMSPMCIPMGAESDPNAIRQDPHAPQCVRNGTKYAAPNPDPCWVRLDHSCIPLDTDRQTRSHTDRPTSTSRSGLAECVQRLNEHYVIRDFLFHSLYN